MGFGDIVLPGLLVAFVCRYDQYRAVQRLRARVALMMARPTATPVAISTATATATATSMGTVPMAGVDMAGKGAPVAGGGGGGEEGGAGCHYRYFPIIMMGYAVGLLLANVMVVVMQVQ